MKLPPSVDVDLQEPALRNYWLRRAEQHIEDSYAGVPIAKFPEDLRVYEHLLWLDGPDTVIELGTQWGGSALWFRDRLATMRSYGRISTNPVVISVDISQVGPRRKIGECGNATGIELIEGNLDDPKIVERVGALVGDRCLVVEDSAHTYETTRAVLEGYARFVLPGGFMVVEDGCVDDERLRLKDWPRGVRPALDAWLESSDGAQFRVRRDLEMYGITSILLGFCSVGAPLEIRSN